MTTIIKEPTLMVQDLLRPCVDSVKSEVTKAEEEYKKAVALLIANFDSTKMLEALIRTTLEEKTGESPKVAKQALEDLAKEYRDVLGKKADNSNKKSWFESFALEWPKKLMDSLFGSGSISTLLTSEDFVTKLPKLSNYLEISAQVCQSPEISSRIGQEYSPAIKEKFDEKTVRKMDKSLSEQGLHLDIVSQKTLVNPVLLLDKDGIEFKIFDENRNEFKDLIVDVSTAEYLLTPTDDGTFPIHEGRKVVGYKNAVIPALTLLAWKYRFLETMREAISSKDDTNLSKFLADSEEIGKNMKNKDEQTQAIKKIRLFMAKVKDNHTVDAKLQFEVLQCLFLIACKQICADGREIICTHIQEVLTLRKISKSLKQVTLTGHSIEEKENQITLIDKQLKTLTTTQAAFFQKVRMFLDKEMREELEAILQEG